MITNDWGRGKGVFFIKFLVVDKSEFAPLIGNWSWLRDKKLLLPLICFKCLGK